MGGTALLAGGWQIRGGGPHADLDRKGGAFGRPFLFTTGEKAALVVL